MSYEGYREYKCACGNVDTCDAYDDLVVCSSCGGHFYAIRSIDQTNDIFVGPWREVEYRQRFKDYVGRGNYKTAKWYGPPNT